MCNWAVPLLCYGCLAKQQQNKKAQFLNRGGKDDWDSY